MLLLPVRESLKKSKQRQKCLSVSNSDEDEDKDEDEDEDEDGGGGGFLHHSIQKWILLKSNKHLFSIRFTFCICLRGIQGDALC